jgi:FMN phosphatase YigB (HAD superfamily)
LGWNKAMLMNDGNTLNKNRFWKTFADVSKLDDEMLQLAEKMSDNFYQNEFNLVKSVTAPTDIPARLIPAMKDKGYELILATNPLFTIVGVETRLSWIGLSLQDFSLVTHYANSTFCKPNPAYYNEIFTKINKHPKQAIMVGNNVKEDMCAAALGADVFLVTDYLENEADTDITIFRNGSLGELETYLLSLPNLAK